MKLFCIIKYQISIKDFNNNYYINVFIRWKKSITKY